MKTAILTALVLVLAVSFESCTRNNDLSNTIPAGTNMPGVAPGLFKVSLYFDDNRDKTSNFSAYSFEFAAGGTIKAISGTAVINGTWSEANNRFRISFDQSPLDKLSHNWVIEEKTGTSMKFLDDNTTENEKVYFTKM